MWPSGSPSASSTSQPDAVGGSLDRRRRPLRPDVPTARGEGVNAADTSSSSCRSRCSVYATIDTRVPKAEKMCAISAAITPPPTITIESGRSSTRMTVSEVCMRCSGCRRDRRPRGMIGRPPAAITIWSAVSSVPDASRSRRGPTNSACSAYSVVLGPLTPVVAPGLRHRVEPPEDPVADVRPADLVDVGVDAEPRAVLGLQGELGGVHEHLGRDAADVAARAAEGRLLDDADVEVAQRLVRDRVARSGPDDDQVMVRHALYGA